MTDVTPAAADDSDELFGIEDPDDVGPVLPAPADAPWRSFTDPVLSAGCSLDDLRWTDPDGDED